MATPTPSLKSLAGAARADRNRAVDLYRALAMIAVAFGHWLAISLRAGDDGAPIAGNALADAGSLVSLTWLFQVMPLFFVVGGFSSAMSLDAHTAADGRPQDWVATRLRRMVGPAVVLGLTWLGLVAAGSLAGFNSIAMLGAGAAAIPLWFLANYTIDTAIAPYVLPAFRRRPAMLACVAGAVFLGVEAIRFAGVAMIPQVNWVLGWLIFQVAGFAWRDGLLPTGRRLLVWATGLWAATIAAVTLGPWPLTMVHVPGTENSPTHPPSLALMLFGAAYSATAIAAAPAVSRVLARSPRAWMAVVAANSMALSVYLWHFTAAVVAGVVLYAAGALPTAEVGTAAWWVQKIPFLLLASAALAGIVAMVARFERSALLSPRRPWWGGQLSMLATAAAISGSIKLWSGGAPVLGAAALALVWFTVVNRRAPAGEAR